MIVFFLYWDNWVRVSSEADESETQDFEKDKLVAREVLRS